jgi:serine/threonine protein kinase/tetratricopeptide (TPR) repeat protein
VTPPGPRCRIQDVKDQGSTIGSYRVLELLGQGGMGVVVRAQHIVTGEVVALKFIRLPHERLLQSLRREIHALARLRHPGIVRIVAEGVDRGLPWYAMELVQGVSLRHYRDRLASGAREPECGMAPVGKEGGADGALPAARAWWTESLDAGSILRFEMPSSPWVAEAPPAHEEPPAARSAAAAGTPLPAEALLDVLTMVRRLCAPLAYLHGEGIVHRDLKPENVLVRPDGLPVLIDFGLLSQFAGPLGRESLQIDTASAGTVHYMAPEQIRRETIDARADLYSLGCMLFELVAGRRPFDAPTVQQALDRHLELPAPRLTDLVEAVPAELDALVAKLLQKRPRDRLGHAADVAAALVRLGAQDGLASGGPRPRPYLYRPQFAGRHAQLAELREHLEQLARGQGSLVLLSGESGAGKTRLAAELGRLAVRSDMLVLTGECRDAGARPLEALRRPLEAIADSCRARGRTHTERIVGRRGMVLALYEPAFRALPGQEAWPEPVELPAQAARTRLFGELAETLRALALERPVLLILDDLQWADDLTLGFLESLLRGSTTFEEVPLLLLGTFRTEEAGEGLQRLLEAPQVARLDLRRLEESAVASITGDMLALSPAPEVLSRFLARSSEGNPFFVAELLRAALDEGLLGRDELGRWQVTQMGERQATEADYEAMPLPRSLHDLVGRRLQGLPEEPRGVAEAAAVAGPETSISLLRAMAGMDEAEVLGAVKELTRRQVLEESGTDELRFVHDKIREVAYERIGPQDRARLHRAAAEGIESVFAGRTDEHLAALGRHWERAGVAVRARECYLAAARRATASYAFSEAERLHRAYGRLVEAPTPESVLARNELGFQVLHHRGRNLEAQAELEGALQEARQLGDSASLGLSLLNLGKVCFRVGQIERARGLHEEALEIARASGQRRDEGLVLNGLANLFEEQSRSAEARAAYTQALAIARELGDRRSEGVLLGNLAKIEQDRGLLEEPERLYEQALRLHREVGDRVSECRNLGNLAHLHKDGGRMAEARQLNEQALDLAREIGNRRTEGIALSNLGTVCYKEGRIEEAMRLLRQALLVHREIGNRRSEAVDLVNLGVLLFDQGRAEEARSLFERALDTVRELGNRRLQGVFLANLATAERRAAGPSGRAGRLLDEAEAVAGDASRSLELAMCLCERGHLALSSGRSAEAFLRDAERLAASIGPGTGLGEVLGRLRRAQQAFEAGERHRLIQGELVEDLPPALRRGSPRPDPLAGGSVPG